MTIVIYSPEKEQPQPRKAAIFFNGVLLEPGYNDLSSASLEIIKNHPDFALYQEWGALSIVKEDLPLLQLKPLSEPISNATLTTESLLDNNEESNTSNESKPRRRRSVNSQSNS